MVTAGAVASTVKARETAAVFWAVSVARPGRGAGLAPSAEGVKGGLLPPRPPSSSWQLNVGGSFEAKLNAGLRSDEVEPFAGPEAIAAVGAWVSPVKYRHTIWL